MANLDEVRTHFANQLGATIYSGNAYGTRPADGFMLTLQDFRTESQENLEFLFETYEITGEYKTPADDSAQAADYERLLMAITTLPNLVAGTISGGWTYVGEGEPDASIYAQFTTSRIYAPTPAG